MRTKKQRKSPNGRRAKRRMGAMRSDLHAWQKDMRGVMDDVSEATKDVRGAVGGAFDRFELWGGENLPGVRDAVRTTPFKACALSLGAGALIGALLLR
jgi:ElaB/YqjD/DUF883 family membrane-anchored ribosome-binding protein